MDKKIKILHLEDSLKDFELIHSIIESGEIEHEYFLTDNEKDFVNLLETEKIDVILADYSMPDYNGNKALKFVKEKYSFIPFIFVSGTIGEDVAISAMLNGATDYVLKNKLERLIPAIKRALKERENNNMKIEAEEALRASEEKYKAIYQYSNDAIMLLYRNVFFDYNPQTLKLFKINSKEEFKKLSPIDLSPPFQSDGRNSLEAAEENIRIAYRDGYNRFDWIHRRANGEEFNADVLLSAFDYGGKRVLQATVRDITERKITEEALENSYKQYRLLFDEMLSGFAVHKIICDQSGKPTDYRFLSVNKSFEKMTGLDASDILGKTVLEVLPETEYSWIERYGKVALTGEPIHFENYTVALGKHYEVRAYCPEHGKFATLINDISERKNAEDSLSESHQFNSQIINSALEGIIVYDCNLKYQVWNPFMENLTGLPASEVIGKHPLDLFPFLKDAGVLGTLEMSLIGERKNGVDFPFTIPATGRTGWASDTTAPLYNIKNEIIGVISTVRDITKYKLAEQELLGKDALLNLTGYTAKVGGWEIDTETMNQKWTDESYKIHEVDLTFNPNVNNGINFYAPSSRPVIEKAVQRAIELGEPFDLELEFITNKGNYRWVHTIGKVQQVNGKTEKVYGSIQDITEHKKTEEELIIKNLIFESSTAANSISDKEGNITHCNAAFLQIWGYDSKDEVIGKPIQFFIKNEDEGLKIITSLSALGLWEGEFTGLKKDSTTFNAYSLATIVQNNKKENIGYYSAVLDITKRKHSEIELINAKEKAEESDRLKTAFLSNMSHEIRTPMNGILGFTNLLKKPNLTSEEQQEFIDIIQVSGARLLNTINSIVDMSKIESGLMSVDIKETNINEKIEFTYKFFNREVENKGLQFFFKNGLPTNEASIKTDNEKVYGILTNLVRNAIKFTFEGSIEFGYEKKGEYLEFFVKDTGIGIPEYQKEIIFERFRQGSESYNRNYEGSGLGLSISKSYVEMLGGSIWVESEEGKGSIFYFTIPYNPVSEETRTIENDGFTENKEVQIKKLKILIVEDDEVSYSLLTRILQNFSKEVLHEITGIKAIETCRNNPDLDLVLMDIRMPQMDGNEATRQIRQFNKDIIIIAQTAYAFSGDYEKAIKAGCNDYISKPIDKTILYELIKKHVNKSRINTDKIYQL